MFRGAQQQHDHLTRTGSASTRPLHRETFLIKTEFSYGSVYDGLHVQRERLKRRLTELLSVHCEVTAVLKNRLPKREFLQQEGKLAQTVAAIADVKDRLSSLNRDLKRIRSQAISEAFMTVAVNRLDKQVFSEIYHEARLLASGGRSVPDTA